VVVERVRCCEPLPQLLVQVDHEDQELWAQWTLKFDLLLSLVLSVRLVLPRQYAAPTVLAPPHEAPEQERYEVWYFLRERQLSPLASQVVQSVQLPQSPHLPQGPQLPQEPFFLMFDLSLSLVLSDWLVPPGQYEAPTVLAPPHLAPPQERYEARYLVCERQRSPLASQVVQLVQSPQLPQLPQLPKPDQAPFCWFLDP